MVLNKTKINNKNNKYNNKQQTTAASTEAVKTKQENLKVKHKTKQAYDHSCILQSVRCVDTYPMRMHFLQ